MAVRRLPVKKAILGMNRSVALINALFKRIDAPSDINDRAANAVAIEALL